MKRPRINAWLNGFMPRVAIAHGSTLPYSPKYKTYIILDVAVDTSVLHGPSLGPRAGPARSPWAGPGLNNILRAGPGARPGPVNINLAGRGPGLALTFPGLGRARAYSESHYYFNIMVKDYLHLSIAKDHCFLCCKCNCTMQCTSMASRQACQPIYYPFNTQQWSSTAELQEST